MADLLPQNVTITAGAVTRPAGRIAKRLAQSFALYGIANFGIRALNFLLLMVYARFLVPHDFGIIYMAEIVAAFLVIVQGLSIDSAVQRLYFQHDHDPEELRSYLGSAIRFGYGWMAVFLVSVLALGKIAQSFISVHISVPFYPYIAMAIATATGLQGVQYCLAIYQVSGRPRSYALLSVVLAVLTAAACLYGVVVRRDGSIGMLRGKMIAALAVFLMTIWKMRTFLTARFQWRYVRESLSFGLPLIPHLVMATGLVVADRFILARYRDLSEVGIYSLAYTFGMVMFLVTQSLSQAWLPMFFELANNGEDNRRMLGRYCSGLSIFLVALACIGVLLSPVLLHVFLDYRYRAAARLVPWIIMGYLFHGLFSLFDLSILQAKRTASIFIISLIAFIVNLALNFAMVPRWGMDGAAWATTIAYGVEAVGGFLVAQRFFPLSYRMPEILAGIAVASGALWLTQSAWAVRWYGLLLVFCTGLTLTLFVAIGRHDLREVFIVLRNARKRESRESLVTTEIHSE
jgi:O-antigen/teichoic acid export membrane protein